MRRASAVLFSFVAALGASREARATAIFGAFAQASLELVGIDHDGSGDGIHVESSYQPDREQGGYEGDALVFFLSEAFADETHVELSSFTYGEAVDGSGFSFTGISGWFDIFNDSSTALTAHFTVTWLLEAETAVNSGLAHAMGGIFVLSTVGGGPFEDSVDLTASSGVEHLRSEWTREFSMVVPPHEGHFFFVSLVAEGSSSADSHTVPEPVATTFLAAALLAAAIAGARIRRS